MVRLNLSDRRFQKFWWPDGQLKPRTHHARSRRSRPHSCPFVLQHRSNCRRPISYLRACLTVFSILICRLDTIVLFVMSHGFYVVRGKCDVYKKISRILWSFSVKSTCYNNLQCWLHVIAIRSNADANNGKGRCPALTMGWTTFI